MEIPAKLWLPQSDSAWAAERLPPTVVPALSPGLWGVTVCDLIFPEKPPETSTANSQPPCKQPATR